MILLPLRRRPLPGEVVGGRPHSRDGVEHERRNALWVRGREQRAHATRVRCTEYRRAARSDRVEDDDEVVHHDFERRQVLG